MARPARMALDIALNVAKTLKPAIEISWEYAKVEMIPPMTGNFFHGTGGKALEKSVSNFGNGIIQGLEGKIKEIDDEEIRKIRAKEAAIKAEQERQKGGEEKQQAEAAEATAAKKAKEVKELEKKVETKSEQKPPAKNLPAKKRALKDTKKK